jgi:tRNA threonylcarbamoyladenosine biosynthesis protein TsaB
VLLLALDTTARLGSCALTHDGVVLDERGSDPARSHAEHLPGDLMTMLSACRRRLEEIDAFAVAIGPGSFTGLRVGIATMQGLAFAMGKPLIGVSALDALARIAQPDPGDPAAGRPLVATWVDAWRGEVFAALYDGDREVEPPTVEPPVAVLERLGTRGSVHMIGDGAATFGALIASTLGDRATIAEPAAPLLAGAIARLATAAWQAGHRPPPDVVRPLYVRRTDAELARDGRPGR